MYYRLVLYVLVSGCVYFFVCVFYAGSLSSPAEKSVDSDGATLVQSSIQDFTAVCT